MNPKVVLELMLPTNQVEMPKLKIEMENVEGTLQVMTMLHDAMGATLQEIQKKKAQKVHVATSFPVIRQ